MGGLHVRTQGGGGGGLGSPLPMNPPSRDHG